MPYGKKSTKRGRRGRARGRKSAAKRGLSKVEREQVRNIVHGQAELKERSLDIIGHNCAIAGPSHITGNLPYKPNVVRIGGFNYLGSNNDAIDGRYLNMRSIKMRLLFTLHAPSPTTLPNLNGPRRVLWWVVTLKNSRIGVHSNVNVNTMLGSDDNDFDSFFKRTPKTFGNFQGDRYDELDPINTDVFTCHSKGKFTIGYSERPVGSSHSEHSQDYGRVPYMKDLYIPIPKFMFGKTALVPDAHYESVGDHTNKKCFLVMTTIPLTSSGDDRAEVSGIKFDARVECKFTDI